MNPTIESVTKAIRERSLETRKRYLQRIQLTRDYFPPRKKLSCGNLAHACAAAPDTDKQTIRLMQAANLGIVTAYNDMLSAHEPLGGYPALIKKAAREVGSSAQVASGVPAMCDGVIQGQPGMELGVFSRDVIAMATVLGLIHNVFDGVICLGVCDKIVPGMLIGALQFGHLPAGFSPGGPMPSGISNKEKAAVRELYAQGKVGRDELLAVESASYHSPGTCTFYGTANSNQVIVEMLGVQLPGSSFVNPQNPLRPVLLTETVLRVIAAADVQGAHRSTADMITEESVVNALVALLATGGSANHTLHLVAIADAAGIKLTWEDFDTVSKVTPTLARIYPNGEPDVNAFQENGGMAFLVRELRGAGLLNENVVNLMGEGLASNEYAPLLDETGTLVWKKPDSAAASPDVLRTASDPFEHEGGLRMLKGNLGEGIIKISAIKPEHRQITAPCVVFDTQEAFQQAFEKGELDRDVVTVVRFQGPRANGMPELHQLTPFLGVLQDRGFHVALLTDGRMSGASGKVPAAIHIAPEALEGGPLARLQDGDVISLDAEQGTLNVDLRDEELAGREVVAWASMEHSMDSLLRDTLGRNLFRCFREASSSATTGASIFY